jgi:transposase
MSRKSSRTARRKFSKEFKREAVRLVQSSDSSMTKIAGELGVRSSVLGAWVRMVEDGEKSGLKTPEQEELVRLRRDNDRLRMEVEILKKATAFFARDSK